MCITKNESFRFAEALILYVLFLIDSAVGDSLHTAHGKGTRHLRLLTRRNV